jgi:hypothetical protein
VFGGADNDPCLYTGDGDGNDLVDGGSGKDRWWADKEDKTVDVEHRLHSVYPACRLYD